MGFIDSILLAKEDPSIPIYLGFFCHELVLNFVKCFFSHQLIRSCDFFLFRLLMWWSALFDFQRLSRHYFLETNPAWSKLSLFSCMFTLYLIIFCYRFGIYITWLFSCSSHSFSFVLFFFSLYCLCLVLESLQY